MGKDEIRMKKDELQIKKEDITVTNGNISQANDEITAKEIKSNDMMNGEELRRELTALQNLASKDEEEEFYRVWEKSSLITRVFLAEWAKSYYNEQPEEDSNETTITTIKGTRKSHVKLNPRLFDEAYAVKNLLEKLENIQNSAEGILNEFKLIKQNKAINDLTRITKKDLKIPEKSNDEKERIKVAGKQEQKLVALKGVADVEIVDYDSLPKVLTASTMQLLDIILLKLTNHEEINKVVELTLEEYMEYRGLSDRKTAQQILLDDMAVLQKTLLKYDYKVKGKRQLLVRSSIIASIGYKPHARTRFFIEISDSFYKGYTIDNCNSIMQYPSALLHLSTYRNPYSYYLGRKISELKRMNAGKKNEDIVSVKTLLSSAPFPTYEEVSNSGRQVTQRIIEPFQRDMNALDDIFTWEYCHTGGTILTEEEIDRFNYQMSYDIFCSLYVKIVWKYYPEVKNKKKINNEQSKDTEAII